MKAKTFIFIVLLCICGLYSCREKCCLPESKYYLENKTDKTISATLNFEIIEEYTGISDTTIILHPMSSQEITKTILYRLEYWKTTTLYSSDNDIIGIVKTDNIDWIVEDDPETNCLFITHTFTITEDMLTKKSNENN